MRLSYIVIPLLVGAVAYAWYWKKIHPEVITVTVTSVQKGDVEATIANTRAGTIKACRRAMLSPSIGGQISDLPFKEGNFAKKDAVLLRVWNEDLKAEVTYNEKAIEAAQDAAVATCLQAEVAKRNADRAIRLRRAGTISQEEFDRVSTGAEVHRANCKAAKSNISVARARLAASETLLLRTILYAPFDGVVAKINGELNEYVTPSPPGILTPPVIDLIEPGCFLVSVPIDEVDAPKVKMGMHARVTLDAWRGRVFEAEVSRMGSYVVDREKQARTVDLELEFKHVIDLDALLVGYSADADIVLQTHQNVLRIPSEAFLDDTHVLVFNPNSKMLEKRMVKKGLHNWSFTEIVEGLKEGEQLVTSLGVEGVKEGALVELDTKAVPANEAPNND